MSDKTERIAISMDPELKQKIRVEAAKRDMSMAALARMILRGEFEGNASRAMMAATAD